MNLKKFQLKNVTEVEIGDILVACGYSLGYYRKNPPKFEVLSISQGKNQVQIKFLDTLSRPAFHSITSFMKAENVCRTFKHPLTSIFL